MYVYIYIYYNRYTCICMYVCMYICMHVRMNEYIRSHTAQRQRLGVSGCSADAFQGVS